MSLETVTVTYSPLTQMTAKPVSYGNIGMVAHGNVATTPDNTVYELTNLTEIGELFGLERNVGLVNYLPKSAMVSGAELCAIMGGGNATFFCVSPTVVADTYAPGLIGGATWSVDLTAEKAASSAICKGSMDIVETGGPTYYQEGVDYRVDYSLDVVHFAEDQDTNTLTYGWDAIPAANYTTAVATLIDEDVNTLIYPYCFDNACQLTLGTHITAALAASKPRIGFVAGHWTDTTTAVALVGGTLQIQQVSSLGNRSGYGGDTTGDAPNETWMEFVDPCCVAAGFCVVRHPGKSLHNQELNGLNQYTAWTSAEVTTLEAAFVNYFAKPAAAAAPQTRVMANSYTNLPTSWTWVDQVRLYQYMEAKFKNNLSISSIIGEVGFDLTGMTTVYNRAKGILYDVAAEGVIDDPDDYPKGERPVTIVAYDILSKPASSRTSRELAYITARKADRTLPAHVIYKPHGAVHYITLALSYN